jgi:uncharacterized membrane protein
MFGLAGSSRRREEVGEYVRGSLWVLPGIAALAALVAGSVLSLVPVPRDGLLYKLVFQGTPDDARTLLIETAGTMISVVALVLGLTVVALQVASSQYSPRLLGNFLRDRPNQIVLSVFVATFAYSMAGFTQSVSPAAAASRSFRGSRSPARLEHWQCPRRGCRYWPGARGTSSRCIPRTCTRPPRQPRS